MTKEDQQQIDALTLEVASLSALFNKMLANQESFARSLNDILNYMETHKMNLSKHRPNKLDS